MNQENNLLTQVQTIVKSYSRINKMSGQNFNLFSLLRKENEEVQLHSMFLAELLNPKGSHQQGTLFLDLFLIQTGIESFETKNAKCYKEYYTGVINEEKTRGGNIDILIRSINDELIKIENKVDASEQQNQLLRYHNFQSHGHLIYLTKTGTKSEIHELLVSKGIKYQQISYKKDIKEWLEACIEKSATVPIVRESIIQYLNLIKKLTSQNINKEMSKEIANKITQSKDSFDAYRSMRKAESEVFTNVIQNHLIPFFERFAQKNQLEVHNLEKSLIKERKQFIGFFFTHNQLEKYGLKLAVQFHNSDNRDMYYGLSFNVENPDVIPVYKTIAEEAKNVMDKVKESNSWWLCSAFLEEYKKWDDIDTLYKMAYGSFQDEFSSKMEAVLNMAFSVIEEYEKI